MLDRGEKRAKMKNRILTLGYAPITRLVVGLLPCDVLSTHAVETVMNVDRKVIGSSPLTGKENMGGGSE